MDACCHAVKAYDAGMRFDDLFADLEAQASAQTQRELWDEAQELSRAERGRLDLGDRLRAGRQWRLRLAGGHGCAGRLLRVEADCLVLDQGGEQWCLQLAAVRSALAEGSENVRCGPASATVRAPLVKVATHPPVLSYTSVWFVPDVAVTTNSSDDVKKDVVVGISSPKTARAPPRRAKMCNMT